MSVGSDLYFVYAKKIHVALVIKVNAARVHPSFLAAELRVGTDTSSCGNSNPSKNGW